MKKLTTLMLICAMLISGSAMAENLENPAAVTSPTPTAIEIPNESPTAPSDDSSIEAKGFSFRDDITWNSTIDEIAQRTGALPLEDELMALYSHVSDVYTANDVAVAGTTADALDFFFYEGTPFVISYSFRDSAANVDLYEKLQAGLTLKYGAPIDEDATASYSVMESLLSHEAVELPLQLGPVSIGPWHIGSVSIGKSESIEALALEKYCAWTCADTRIYLALEGSDLVIRYENLPAIDARTEAISAANAATAIDGL